MHANPGNPKVHQDSWSTGGEIGDSLMGAGHWVEEPEDSRNLVAGVDLLRDLS